MGFFSAQTWKKERASARPAHPVAFFLTFHSRLLSGHQVGALHKKPSEDAPHHEATLVICRRCLQSWKNKPKVLSWRWQPWEMPGPNQDATPVVCKLTLSWTGATDTSPPGVALTSQGRHVINSGLEYQRWSTAVQNDIKPLPLCAGTAAQNIALSGTSLWLSNWYWQLYFIILLCLFYLSILFYSTTILLPDILCFYILNFT